MIHNDSLPVVWLIEGYMPWKGYQKVRTSYLRRGYETVHALGTPYKDGHWAIVHELQNSATLTCFWVCYVVGPQGGLFEASTFSSGSLRRLSPHRIDLSLHAIPADGLELTDCLREAGLVPYESEVR